MELERTATSNKQTHYMADLGMSWMRQIQREAAGEQKRRQGRGGGLKIIRLLPLGLNKNTEKSGRSAFRAESSTTTSKHKIAGLGQSTWASLGLNKNKGKRPGSRDEPAHLT